MEQEKIEWRNVVGTDGLYQANQKGEIMSLYLRQGKILKPSLDQKGYHVLNLKYPEGTKSRKVHRLVLEAFVPNIENHPHVNHKDGNKTNNSVSNLEWCTAKHNNEHAIHHRLNLSARGEKSGSAKLKDADIITIRNLFAKGVRMSEMSKSYGVSAPTIRSIVKRKTWKHIKVA